MADQEQFGALSGRYEGDPSKPVETAADIEGGDDGTPPSPPAQPEKPVAPEKPTKAEEPAKADDKAEKPGDGEDKHDSHPRQPSFVPAWKVAIERKQWEKDKTELETRLAALEQGKPPQPKADDAPAPKADTPSNDDELRSIAKRLAEQRDVEEELAYDIIKEAVTAAKKGMPDVGKLLEEIDSLKKVGERVQQEQSLHDAEAAFTKDFEKERIAELVKNEYPDATEADIDSIKKTLFAKAHTEEYKLVDLAVIFRGDTDFRDLIAPKNAPTAERSRGGARGGGVATDFSSLSPEQVADLGPEQRAAYLEWHERKGRE